MLIIDEDAELAGFLEIHHGGEKGDAFDAAVAAGRHIGQRGRHQGAANAIADGVDLALSGRLFYAVKRGDRPLEHIVSKVFLGGVQFRGN